MGGPEWIWKHNPSPESSEIKSKQAAFVPAGAPLPLSTELAKAVLAYSLAPPSQSPGFFSSKEVISSQTNILNMFFCLVVSDNAIHASSLKTGAQLLILDGQIDCWSAEFKHLKGHSSEGP